MIYIKNEYNKNYFEGNKINKIVKEEKYEEEGKKSKNNSKKSLKNFNSSTFFSFKSLMMNIKKPNIQKKINEIMNEFSFHSIEDGKDDKYKNNLEKVMGFEKLRKEFEIKKELNQLELKKMKKKKVSLLEKFKMEEENNKKYRGKKITKDHNGEIIFIKKMKLENFKKEFFIPKTFSIFIKEEKKEKELTNKNLSDISTFEKDIIKDKIKSKENLKIFNKLKTLKIINESKKYLPLINKPKRAINIEYNKEGNETEKLKDIGDLNNKNQNNKIKKPFIPSGSSFDLMNLEVGVSLKEENKYKSGGKDFYSKYKKYSIFNFDKDLKDYFELNSLRMNTKYKNSNTYNISDLDSKNESHPNNIKNNFFFT